MTVATDNSMKPSPLEPNVAQLLQKSSPFTNPEMSLPCSQEPDMDPFSEANESSSHDPTIFF
jgi:hypothetical protein